MNPTRRLENQLKKRGYKIIAGLDEAGKGSLAGPLVAGCVILPDNFRAKGIKDSKLLSPNTREELFLYITKNALQWSVGVVDQRHIDKFGIRESNAEVFRKALRRLKQQPDYVLLDGLEIAGYPFNYQYVVNGDALVTSIAAASIIAKVIRDQMMSRLDQDYPAYGFKQHKGYGTVDHLRALKASGPSSVHRATFSPVKNLI
jgi:ribonuclease HII